MSRMPSNFSHPLLAVLAACGLSACAVGPDYRQPELATLPGSFKHEAGWQTVQPREEPAAADENAPWWQPFADPTLDALLRELAAASPGVAQAEARYRQAQAALRATRAGFSPTVGASAGARRSSSGAGSDASIANALTLDLSASWTPDLWGRLRREAEAGRAELQASAADLAALRLSLQATLAQNYIRLRIFDLQRELLAQTEQAYLRSLELTRNQYDAGFAARADVVQAETQLESVRAELLDLAGQRATVENAVAVLAGRPPSALDLGADGSLPQLPAVPPAMPASLLTRRPDLVVAERRVAAANARIGVAEAAWFPELTLSLSGGYQSGSLGRLLDAPSRVWALGPTLAATLFDGGARSAAVEQAVAAHEESAAAWREAVLAALQETEDALARLRALEALAAQQGKVVALAQENERLVTNRYRSGLVSFLEVAVAQNTTLSARRAALDVTRDRLEASVQLVASLGGGWAPALE
ncbi:efflux transporter outer membrane subunit [Azoarcus indigens]|uniref:NodT family efflux transporter outer membrane factor (OMF) lipoprotein n=2 Tax=Azoarcus indigens TaxID=29545 RepID=A0A4R6DV04_9RHOO|nr:efflux transporter outer membrane subunit [Azoarcus indigens]TDN48987.1 NodT family efflux transporter outer membrane factor (OMF) lipoprotein [Azoarcus indigens]